MKLVAVLASGRGSNFQAIIDATRSGDITAGRCSRLITDNPGAYAIVRAKEAEIPVSLVDYRTFPSRDRYEDQLIRVMRETDADLFVLAGYMRILGKGIVHEFSGRIMNIHPALLPSFPGLHAQRQALECGVKVAGCTVHLVDEGMDTGPIVLQECVQVIEGDTEESLSERILQREHRCLPRAVQLFCEGRIRVEDGRVRIL
ncbi:phosphoribosylglycinamide formyltransferase-1 [Methanolinea mesophila]|uniref:phosphoribosylglycinamide formyltransferase n=1 Tax=Methanolinea mesophila TaxID=547055 RepID=UPI001AE8B5D4|nr:phosphoribosylglycinamide formyltransferase [Methanolinea mesophila]MBP1929708.1 phosphoribosylglycinamide formyltransferase-1 [Methanolinea mesophila]